jgi:hypothetical protein
MEEQEEILGSYVKELLLSELRLKNRYKLKKRNFWKNFREKIYDYLDKNKIDTRNLKSQEYENEYGRYDSGGYGSSRLFSGTFDPVPQVVNSFFNHVERYSDKKFSTADRKKSIENSKKIYQDSISQGDTPREAMELVIEYLNQNLR